MISIRSVKEILDKTIRSIGVALFRYLIWQEGELSMKKAIIQGIIVGLITVLSISILLACFQEISGGNSKKGANAKLTNLELSSLELSSGTLSPAFGANMTAYTAQVDNTVSSVTVTPTAANSKSTIAVNGNTVISGTASLPINLLVGPNTITIVVLHRDSFPGFDVRKLFQNRHCAGYVLSFSVYENIDFFGRLFGFSHSNAIKTYTVVITRLASVSHNADLVGLSLSTGSVLYPVFNPNTIDYTARVANNVSSISVMPAATDSNSTITVNGEAVISGTPSQSIDLDVGPNTITTVVTAQDGTTTKTYTVTVTRNNGFWTWVSGDDTTNQSGIYGTMGVADPANIPGSRYDSISWTDSSGNLWLFGGYGYDSEWSLGYLNDLWKFNGTDWTWVSGDKTVRQSGIYGSPWVADPANKPGSRYRSISWTDSSGNLWLFGGSGLDSAGNYGNLNDLWKLEP